MEIVRVPNPAKADGKPAVVVPSYSVEVSHAVTLISDVTIHFADPVTVDGHVADSTEVSTLNRLIGLSVTEVSPGEPVSVLVSGRIENIGWAWAEGDLIFLNGKQLSTSAPSIGYIQQVGKADTPTSIILSISSPVLL